MKKQNLLINLGLVFSLLFCLAFACGDGNEGGGSGQQTYDNGGDAPSRQTNGGLPAGEYACFTTVSNYVGRGAGGFPIYNYSKQGRGTIRVKSNGTYINPDGGSCRYSYNQDSNEINWLDCTFRESSSSSLVYDAAGNPSIQIKFNGDKDVWGLRQIAV